MTTCFFIGHRDAPEEVRPLLAEAIERHIAEYGVKEFVVGHYGAFDRMAAHAVRNAKERHPDIRLALRREKKGFMRVENLADGLKAPFPR